MTWREIREEPPPESLEARMKREQAELAEAVEKFSKPKTLNELLEEYDDQIAMAEN